MERLKEFFQELPQPVRIWSLTIGAAFIYVIFRYFQVDGQEGFNLLDRALALYTALSLIVFLGFFMTSDPE